MPPNLGQSRSECFEREATRPWRPLSWSINIAFSRPWTVDHTLGCTPPSTCALSMRPRIPSRLSADWEVSPPIQYMTEPHHTAEPQAWDGEDDDMSMESCGTSCQRDATYGATPRHAGPHAGHTNPRVALWDTLAYKF